MPCLAQKNELTCELELAFVKALALPPGPTCVRCVVRALVVAARRTREDNGAVERRRRTRNGRGHALVQRDGGVGGGCAKMLGEGHDAAAARPAKCGILFFRGTLSFFLRGGSFFGGGSFRWAIARYLCYGLYSYGPSLGTFGIGKQAASLSRKASP